MQLLLIDRPNTEQTPLARQLRAAGLRLDCVYGTADACGERIAFPYSLELVDISRLAPWAQVLLDERQVSAHVPMIALVPKETLEGNGPETEQSPDARASATVAMPKLMARLDAILARDSGVAAKTYRAGALTVSPDAQHVSFAGKPLALSKRELAALTLLVRYAPHPVPRQTLETNVHASGAVLTSNAIEAVLSRLRRALKKAGCPTLITSLRGIGWHLHTPKNDGGQNQ